MFFGEAPDFKIHLIYTLQAFEKAATRFVIFLAEI
jgi:hypothetical protein